MERNNPQTSLDAYKSINGKILAEHYLKIIRSLKRLNLATYEELAHDIGFGDKNQVSRRLKEMEGLELVYKPGTKKNTSSGRGAYQYALRSPETVVPVLEKLTPETITSADYANMLIAQTKLGKAFQANLFDDEK